MSWKNVLKKQDEEDERHDIYFKLQRTLDNWLNEEGYFESMMYMTGHMEDVYGNEELIAQVEFENNSEDDLSDEEAWEADEGFFIIQFYTNTKSPAGSPYDVARYNLTYNEGIIEVEPLSEIDKIPIHIARKLVN